MIHTSSRIQLWQFELHFTEIRHLSHARDQWCPTYNLRICEIWTKISRQNHFSIRTLIFPSRQSLSESVHYHQRDIFRKKLKKFDLWSPAIEPWYPGWYKNIRYNICGIRLSSVASVSSRHAYCWDRSTWCRGYVLFARI
jgi:hypothetical protein